MEAAANPDHVTVYTDGSFDLVRVPLLASLTMSRTDLTAQYGRGATGIYVPPSQGRPALALQLTTPVRQATDAYYQELLGTAMGALLVQNTPTHAYSDCQAAIRRFRHASNPLGSSIGQLQYGPLLQGIRKLMLHTTTGHELQWTKSHPERIKPRMDWTADDQGIYMADLVAQRNQDHYVYGGRGCIPQCPGSRRPMGVDHGKSAIHGVLTAHQTETPTRTIPSQ